MVEQIMYNITMVTLLICWLIASYLCVKCDDEHGEYILASMMRQTSFQTMCLVALIGHDLFLK